MQENQQQPSDLIYTTELLKDPQLDSDMGFELPKKLKKRYFIKGYEVLNTIGKGKFGKVKIAGKTQITS